MKSKTNSLFTKVEHKAPSSSSFDLSHDKKMSFNMGTLIPSLVQEVLPGDAFSISAENFLRLAPLVSPVMHKINVDTRYFFVPNRIVWPGWEDWITGESEAEVPVIEQLTPLGGWAAGCLGDYLGYVPHSNAYNTQKVSALPIAAYYKIYDEYYRDQNLIDPKFVPLNDGNTNLGYRSKVLEPPLRRAWQHDYFTSCLPFAQKGDAVTLPLLSEQETPVQWREFSPPGLVPAFRDIDGTTPVDPGNSGLAQASGAIRRNQAPSQILAYDPQGTLYVDVNNEASSIATLRRAFRLQEWLEKNARGGTRMIEMLYSHFGVSSSDKRLQRPEYF